jgi:hypothetical protein
VNPLIMYYNCQIAAMSCIVHRSLVDARKRGRGVVPAHAGRVLLPHESVVARDRGRVVAEAMATGLPCVCASNVGLAELIAHGVDGFVFDADDDESALAHLRALRDDRELRRAVGRAARARAEQVYGTGFVQHIRDAYLGPGHAGVSFPPQ